MISLAYGIRQSFRPRHEDINILGSTSLTLPVKRSDYYLNDSGPIHFYVEPETGPNDPPLYPWKARTPSVNRLRDLPGCFNIEIPVNSPWLRSGANRLLIAIYSQNEMRSELTAEINWDPARGSLPLDLTDLRQIDSIQAVAQAVNGIWDLDIARNAIIARAPIAHDALLLLGFPHGSQEAVYDVQFMTPMRGAFIGLSDFFLRHEEQIAGLGIKPGYSTAGLATLDPLGGGRVGAICWMAMGDSLSGKKWTWVRKSMPAILSLSAGVLYTVRHQVIFDKHSTLARFRIWQSNRPEPSQWVCVVNNVSLDPKLPRASKATFGLFQYCETPALYSNIRIQALEASISSDDMTTRKTIVGTWRNAQYAALHLSKRVKSKVITIIRHSNTFGD